MKKQLLTALFIFSSFACADLTVDEKQAQIEHQNWDNEFTDILVNHDNPNLRMIGLSELSRKYMPFSGEVTQIDLTEFIQTLTDLINQENLQVQSLLIAAGFCENPQIKNLCPTDLLYKKLIESEPKNLTVYYPELSYAVINKDTIKIKQLLQQMSLATYSNSYNVISTALDSEIDSYINNNVGLKNHIQNEISQMKKLGSFSKGMIQSMEDNPENYQKIMQKINFKLKLPIPPYRSLSDTCKTQEEFSLTCLKIADTIIKNSKTLISTIVGYNIKKDVFYLLNLHPQFENAELFRENFITEYQCIIDVFQAGNNSLDKSPDRGYYNIGTKIERKQDEYAAFKKLAEINYNRLGVLGIEVKNPKDCFIETELPL